MIRQKDNGIYVYDRPEGKTVGVVTDGERKWITITDAATDDDAIATALHLFESIS